MAERSFAPRDISAPCHHHQNQSPHGTDAQPAATCGDGPALLAKTSVSFDYDLFGFGVPDVMAVMPPARHTAVHEAREPDISERSAPTGHASPLRI
jgi:hypothetical protein